MKSVIFTLFTCAFLVLIGFSRSAAAAEAGGQVVVTCTNQANPTDQIFLTLDCGKAVSAHFVGGDLGDSTLKVTMNDERDDKVYLALENSKVLVADLSVLVGIGGELTNQSAIYNCNK